MSLETVILSSDQTPAGMGKPRSEGNDSLPSPIDVHVGARIRERRILLGMSQERLGDALNLTFQQIQKYERGANRVGASRLYDLCRVFDVTADFFFEGLPNFGAGKRHRAVQPSWPTSNSFAEGQAAIGDEPAVAKDVAELANAFAKITDPRVRERILDLVRALT